MQKTRTVHIANDIHRLLKAAAANEELPVSKVLDRVLRYALNLPTDTTAGQQQDLMTARESVPEVLRR